MAKEPRDGPEASTHPGISATSGLEDKVNQVVKQGFANSTIHQYNGVLRKFTKFAESHLLPVTFPISTVNLACFGAWLSEQGYKPGTVSSHLAAMGWWHKIKGFPDPSKEYLIRRFKLGLAKSGPPVKQATPVRFPLLKRILASLPQFLSDTDAKLFKAAFSLAYFASLS